MGIGNELQERESTGSETQGSGTTDVLETDDSQWLLERWGQAEVQFVEDPRNAVKECDALVLDAMRRVTASFHADRLLLERKWSQGEPSTEELRLALQRYRAFFKRLLSV